MEDDDTGGFSLEHPDHAGDTGGFSLERPEAPPEASRFSKFMSGMRDPVQAAAQIEAHVLPQPAMDAINWVRGKTGAEGTLTTQGFDQATATREKDLGATGAGPTNPYRIGGNIAATLPLAALNPLASGAASGALSPVTGDDFWTQKAEQTAGGAVAGKAAQLGGNVLGKLIGPTANTAKEALMKAGATLTPGQMMGTFGRRVEEAGKSLPFTGSLIRKGEERALDSFNVATVNKSLEPIGATIKGKTGREAIQEGQKVLSAAYDKTLDKIKQVGTDKDFSDAIGNIRSMTEEMAPGLSAQFDAILKNRVAQRFSPTGTMDGKTLKQVESELTHLGRNLSSSADAAQRQLGDAVNEVRGALRDAVARQNPEAAAELKQINRAYSQFADVELAASRRATSGARFTPADLLQAVKRSDRSPRDRAFAAGEGGPLQGWAEDAHQLIGSKMPDSGTAERWAHMNIPALMTGLATLPLAAGHTEIGMDMLRKLATAAPQTRNFLADLMAKAGQSSAPAAAVGADALIGP